MKELKIEFLKSNGYERKFSGYTKRIKGVNHWATFYEGNKIQLYAYFSTDREFDKIYDTGIIELSAEELKTFVLVLNRNN